MVYLNPPTNVRKVDHNLLFYAKTLSIWNTNSGSYVEAKSKLEGIDKTGVDDAELIEIHKRTTRFFELMIFFGAKERNKAVTASDAVSAFANDISKALKDRLDYTSNWLEFGNLGLDIDKDWKRLHDKYYSEYKKSEIWKVID